VETLFERFNSPVIAIGDRRFPAGPACCSRLGQEVKLTAPQLIEPYVKRGKNEAATPKRFEAR
jgi:hypothetical protein